MLIYLIRHDQSAFNAVHDPNKPDPMIFDSPITELGETQAKQARIEIEKLDIKRILSSIHFFIQIGFIRETSRMDGIGTLGCRGRGYCFSNSGI